eukprot:CAMPEP_0167762438 /NCGR_PEP_ID=MMETSP0110_2-20121227/12767_1 /TAXON_ID=629695 /ORGANISM="Gymnochlora sp., Strain CCMP2014" /LENGTH=151 /DNA_ID=CAMNT_0007649311 /DNA_START=389 /DNA_END=844 /DNA_ORIENTATION=-
MTSEKITKKHFVRFVGFLKRTSINISSQLQESFSAKNKVGDVKLNGPSKHLEVVNEEDEQVIKELDAEAKKIITAQVHRARVKFFKVTMDIISAGSKLGLFDGLPSPLIYAASIASASCVIHLEMTDINRTLEKQKAAPKPRDFVRDRSIF